MDSTLDWLVLCSVILFAKMFAISLYQGWHRIGRGSFRNVEDAKFAKRTPVAEELPEVQRAARAWANDLENIPVFFALGILYVMTGASAAAAPWLFGTFTVARIGHTFCYLNQLQPWRTLSFGIGIGCLIGMSALLLRGL
ncbi:MAG TPA: MAPEG family protein [Fontimonas sp.]